MRRLALSLALLALGGCSGPTPAPTQAPVSAPDDCTPVDTTTPPKISSYVEGGIEVHTFLAPNSSANTATHVVETPEGLIVIDTQMLRTYAQQFREFVDSLGKPVTHVIITHGHPDHYFGLEYFDDLPTYALPETRVDMTQRNKFHLRMHREMRGECDAVTDRVRFVSHDLPTGAQTLAGLTLTIEDAKDAEDSDQVVIRIPSAKTLILQDLMATDAHGFTAAGMVEHWIEILRGYEAVPGYTHVLAGHGSPTDHEGISAMITYLGKSQEILETAETQEEFVEAMRTAFPERTSMYIVDMMAMMGFTTP